jgi:aryl-alcohol dehydrogenase-like predicted oxidoreductase
VKSVGHHDFGQQNTEADAHEQLDYATQQGVNFIDTAEMYPIAARQATYGSTETFIGNWLKKTGKRNELVIATKIAGPNRNMGYIREKLDYSRESILLSVEKSCSGCRPTTSICINYFERKVNFFGQRGFKIEEDPWQDNFQGC